MEYFFISTVPAVYFPVFVFVLSDALVNLQVGDVASDININIIVSIPVLQITIGGFIAGLC